MWLWWFYFRCIKTYFIHNTWTFIPQLITNVTNYQNIKIKWRCVCEFMSYQSFYVCSSTSTIDWSIWLPRTTTTLWTSSEVPTGRSAWHQLAWCSSTMCCRTWRGANRLKNYGSGSRWRWPLSHPDCSRDQRGQSRPISCSCLPHRPLTQLNPTRSSLRSPR